MSCSVTASEEEESSFNSSYGLMLSSSVDMDGMNLRNDVRGLGVRSALSSFSPTTDNAIRP